MSAAPGNTVRFHYTGRLTDGTEFDSSAEREPLQVTLGKDEVIAGVDGALTGMAAGEAKTVTIDADQAYGPHRPELVQEVDRARIPPEVEVEVGAQLQGADGAGRQLRLTVIDVSEQTVTVDANHPLAGQDLTFDLELVEIV